ncbi:hypothetical protein [Sciscionella marina]|uniref:hypothetical protein n=1 Tax=Sciscionella marina TaxID=508770 RepID=UPI0012F67DF2|nr:hypothetical protein [Sciscionella marina]
MSEVQPTVDSEESTDTSELPDSSSATVRFGLLIEPDFCRIVPLPPVCDRDVVVGELGVDSVELCLQIGSVAFWCARDDLGNGSRLNFGALTIMRWLIADIYAGIVDTGDDDADRASQIVEDPTVMPSVRGLCLVTGYRLPQQQPAPLGPLFIRWWRARITQTAAASNDTMIGHLDRSNLTTAAFESSLVTDR